MTAQKYKAYKDSGVSWLGEIPATWELLSNKFIAYSMTKKQLFKLLARQIKVSRFEAHVRRDLLKRLHKLHRQVKRRIGE